MNNYADYEFYSKVYKGQLDEPAFDQNIVEASRYLRYISFGKAEGYVGDELKCAVCAVIDVYGNFNSKTAMLSAENTDGYSASFVVERSQGETLEQLRDRKAYEASRKWLLGTGLLSRKCRCTK